MPELPEVESVRCLMRRALQGKKIHSVEMMPDEIILSGRPPEAIQAALVGRTVLEIGRKGKYWWLELDEKPWMFGHLGMTGWIREIGKPMRRLKDHGEAPQEDSEGNPRFLKLKIEAEDGTRIALTDGRRLARLWLGDDPNLDPRIMKLGFDCLDEVPSAKVLQELLAKRKAPMKAILLDQSVFAGVGNYLADEILYHSKIAPKRLGNSLTQKEVAALQKSLKSVIQKAVAVDADYEQFPESWLFHHRWGGGRGEERIGKHLIVRETVGGRTTAWVPDVQQ
jgi:formamidopyrimidine-DNA glycosylase